MFENLTDDNFVMYAMKSYDNPNCVQSEFEEDLNRILYIKRLLTKYREGRELKERLLLNHIIILYNVFGVEAATRILFYRLDEIERSILKTFLLFLNCMPVVVKGISGKDINSSDIPIDMEVAKVLRNLK